MQSNLAMSTRQLLESVGLTLDGRVTCEEIKLSLNSHSIGITLTASCARNWDTEATTEASPKPSPCKPTSPNPLSSGSSPSTSKLFPLIYVGINGPTIH